MIYIGQAELIVKEGEIVGFYGPTGCGKTTLLNKIASEYSEKYKISYAFQENRLIPELSVFKNIVLPLENEVSEINAKKTADEWIENFDLICQKNKKTKHLSGGEAQRVNLARAFSWNGDIFLLDEPFSAQDEQHKQIISSFIKELKNQNKIILIVSHSRQDLIDLNCRIVEF